MAFSPDFQTAFKGLRSILKKFESKLTVACDKPGKYVVNGAFDEKRKSAISFGSAEIKKNYVSFHLMPVYCCDTLKTDISPALKKRMQGKACFNFKQADAALFKELAALTKKGLERFKKAGYV